MILLPSPISFILRIEIWNWMAIQRFVELVHLILPGWISDMLLVLMSGTKFVASFDHLVGIVVHPVSQIMSSTAAPLPLSVLILWKYLRKFKTHAHTLRRRQFGITAAHARSNGMPLLRISWATQLSVLLVLRLKIVSWNVCLLWIHLVVEKKSLV